MQQVAASFGWPFRGAWLSRFLVGSLTVFLLPVAFIPLLGYAIAATRAVEQDAALPPPPWKLSRGLLADGFWTAVAIALLSAPFVLALSPLADAIDRTQLWRVADRQQAQAYAHLAAAAVLALPWGFVMLLLMPHAAGRFAGTGRPHDLFDFPAALRGVQRDFPTWNAAAAAMVTAWVIGIACVGLLCVGLLPGVFYAILVSAHASASLRTQAGASGAHPPPG
ncbi:MAG TPA: DUF4013 domain-containing protein [Candidatus Dormibacteraeota bacterium]|nr:DUF4013 domain-containing protein [Candidatus Dormibacteraeota bacterium]